MFINIGLVNLELTVIGLMYIGVPIEDMAKMIWAYRLELLSSILNRICFLGEQEGTGTEVVYADHGGGLDAAYDWSLYWNGIRSFGFNSASVNALHSKLANAGYYPGENAYYLRYLENQDEDRITYIFNSFEKTMPLATSIFMAPGLVQMLNGQEVGFGKGMGASGEPDLNDRRRGIIDWNFSGKESDPRTVPGFFSAPYGYKR